jgi:hypothetical protein
MSREWDPRGSIIHGGGEMNGTVCWYCHWGWPKQVRDIYDHFEEIAGWDAMHYGPAHIVWSDENFDSVQWCLDNAEEWMRGTFTDAQLNAVIESLKQLAALPKEIRECEPEGYAGHDPESFPPADTLVMVKK